MNDFKVLAIQTQMNEILNDIRNMDINCSMNEDNFMDRIKEVVGNLKGLEQMYTSLLLRVKKFLELTDKADKNIITQYGRLKSAIIEDLEECSGKVKHLFDLYKLPELNELLNILDRLHATVMDAHFSKTKPSGINITNLQ